MTQAISRHAIIFIAPSFLRVPPAFFALLHASDRNPDFWPYFSNAFNHFAPCPDFTYYVTPIDPQGTYRISGNRKSVKRVDFQFGKGRFIPEGIKDDFNLGVSVGNYDLDALPIDDTGYFEVTVSREKPADSGCWWQMKPQTSYLLIRQVAYDWADGEDAQLAIERLDTPATPPRQDVDDLHRRMKGLAVWTDTNLRQAMGLIRFFKGNGWVNKVDYLDLTKFSGHATQRYAYGCFDIASDEALVIEIDHIPDSCRYWSIHLTDELFNTIDFSNRIGIINGSTASVDADGKCRIVVSERDPGIENWLDCSGYGRGGIQIRWELASSWPKHATIRTKLSDLESCLAADVKRISAEMRERKIRESHRGLQWRKRW